MTTHLILTLKLDFTTTEADMQLQGESAASPAMAAVARLIGSGLLHEATRLMKMDPTELQRLIQLQNADNSGGPH